MYKYDAGVSSVVKYSIIGKNEVGAHAGTERGNSSNRTQHTQLMLHVRKE